MRIAHLVDVPEAAPTLALWFIEEWAPWYGPGGAGNAEEDLAACRNRDALPICLVALDENDDILGTAALKDDSVGSEFAVGPWLAAILVGEPYRRQGIGTALVAAIEREAVRLGFDAIYTSTDAGSAMVERRRWRAIGVTQSLRGSITVYRLGIRDVTG